MGCPPFGAGPALLAALRIPRFDKKRKPGLFRGPGGTAGKSASACRFHATALSHPNPTPRTFFKSDSAVGFEARSGEPKFPNVWEFHRTEAKSATGFVFERIVNETKSRTGAGFERPRKSDSAVRFHAQAANPQALADFSTSGKSVSADGFGKHPQIRKRFRIWAVTANVQPVEHLGIKKPPRGCNPWTASEL